MKSSSMRKTVAPDFTPSININERDLNALVREKLLPTADGRIDMVRSKIVNAHDEEAITIL